MNESKTYELLSQKKLNAQDTDFLNRVQRRLAGGHAIVGRERVLLGKLYKRIFGVWPFDESAEDVKRRQDTALMLLKAIEDAQEGGIIVDADLEKFRKRMQNIQADGKEITQKDFNFLFFCSKKYSKELAAYLPAKPSKAT